MVGFGQPESRVTVTLAPALISSMSLCLHCAKSSVPLRPLRPPALPSRRPQHGEVLPLKIVTYAAVSLSLAALLVAFVLLALLRTLRSNLHSIHKNLIGALFFSQLVFVIGITQTGNPVRPPAAPSPGCACSPADLFPGRRQRCLRFHT